MIYGLTLQAFAGDSDGTASVPLQPGDASGIAVSIPGSLSRNSQSYDLNDIDDEDLFVLKHRVWMSRVLLHLNSTASSDPITVSSNSASPLSAQMAPDDTYYASGDMWGWEKIDMEHAWDISTGTDIIVAVLDTGIDRYHTELDGQLFYNTLEIPGNGIDDDGNGYIDDDLGWDFVGSDSEFPLQDNDVTDTHGHGTHVGGIIAAKDNTEGVIGVAPDAKILPVRVLDDEGHGTIDMIAQGIKYAVDMGAKVINLSLGAAGYASSFLVDMVSYALDAGAILVASAGNDSADANGYTPANMTNVITVSATDQNDDIASFSNYGSCVDVAAPGVQVLSLRAEGTDIYGGGGSFEPLGDPDAEYYWASGTSMSAPFVSGLVALLLADDPTLTLSEIKQKLYFSSVDLGDPGFDEYFGYGRIDAYQALQYQTQGDDEYDAFDFWPLDFNNEFQWKVEATGTPADNWTILGSPISIGGNDAYNNQNQLGEEEYYSKDAEGIKLHGYKAWDSGTETFEEIIFDDPLLILTRYARVGDIIQDSTTFTYQGSYPGTYSVSTTIDAITDLQLTAGTLLRDVIKATHTINVQIDLTSIEGGIYTDTDVNECWYMENIGAVKQIYENEAEEEVTEILDSCVNYYASGNILSEFLDAPDGNGFIIHERKDEDHYGGGEGRITKSVRPDSGYTLFREYWNSTDTVKVKEIYSTEGNILEMFTYNSDGTESDHAIFFASGRLKHYVSSGYTTAYKDEDFYGTAREQGRLESTEDPDGSYKNYTYFTGEKRLKTYESYEASSGKTRTKEFYDESYFNDPTVMKDSYGNIIKKARIWDGSDNGWDGYIIKYDEGGNILNIIGLDSGYADMWYAMAIDSSDSVIVAGDVDDDLNLRKYGQNGDPVWNRTYIWSTTEWWINSMIVDDQDDIIMTGTYSSSGSRNMLLSKIDGDTGDFLWSRTLDVDGYDDTGYEVSIDTTGNIVVTGLAGTSAGKNPYAATYDPDGDRIDSGWSFGRYLYLRYDQEGAPVAREYRSQTDSQTPTYYHAYYGDRMLILETALSALRSGTLYWYYDAGGVPVSSYVDFTDDSLVLEGEMNIITSQGHIEELQIERALYNNLNTAWFLWGDNRISYNDVWYSNVVFEETAGGVWNMYSDFTQVSSGLDDVIDPNNWTEVTTGIDPASVQPLLPEAEPEWWDWVSDNDIAVEFPALSVEYFDTGTPDGLMDERVHHNDLADTIYSFSWDDPGPGLVRVDVSYDMDHDGSADPEYTGVESHIYSNGLDMEASSMNDWKEASDIARVTRDGVTLDHYDGAGSRVYAKEYYETSRSSEFYGMLIKRYYLNEGDPGETGREFRVDAPADPLAGDFWLGFDGQDDLVDCGSSGELDLGNDLTIVANARIAPGGGGYLVSKRDGEDCQYGMAIAPDTGRLVFVYGTANNAIQLDLNFFDADWRDNRWHQFAITVREASPPGSFRVRGNVDGVDYRERCSRYTRGFRSRGASGITSFPDVPLLIGARGDGAGGSAFNLDGDVSDVRIYGRGLSSQEIGTLFSGADVQTGLAAHWDAHEGAGSSLADLNGSNAGTIEGAAWTENTGFYWTTEYANPYDAADTRLDKKTKYALDTDAFLQENTYYSDASNRLATKKLAGANANGEKAFRYRDYFQDTGQARYIDSYTDLDMTSLYGTYEYDQGGNEIDFTPAGAGSALAGEAAYPEASPIMSEVLSKNSAIAASRQDFTGYQPAGAVPDLKEM